MSRQATANTITSTSNHTDEALISNSDDICPVCKSSHYMNPNMRFLVNPECYHRMCSSCVDRIFAAGRAKCPIAKCPKMLRKAGFRKQIFDDVRMERERDIRSEIAEVFNQREDDFETLADYNNYLEMVEDISFGLVNGIDVQENRRKLESYRERNAADIKANKSLRQDEETRFAARQVQEREQARLRNENARREASEERREAEEARKEIVDAIARGDGNAEAIARAGEERLKKSKLKRESSAKEGPHLTESAVQKPKSAAVAPTTAGMDDTFVIRGLKQRVKVEPEKPYDPFGGITIQMSRVALSDKYDVAWLQEARNDDLVSAGGYDLPAYCQQLLASSFSGLAVFVGDES